MRLELKILNFLLFTSIFLLFSNCERKEKVKSLKLGHSLDTKHPVHLGLEFLSEKVTEISEGKLTIKIYPNGQLGTEREAVELLQVGSLDMTKVSSAVLENFSPTYKVLGLPYIFRDQKHAFSVLDGPIGKELLTKTEDAWIRGICFYDAGARSFYFKDKPIRTPDDLQGMKVRVMNSPIAFSMIKAMGGSPTPISFGELYTSLQQGVVDGAENNPPSFYSSKHYEVCQYYSLDEHSMVPDVLVISTHAWKDLNQQERGWLMNAARQSVEFQRKVWAEGVKEALDEVQKAGVEIIRPDKAPFKASVQSVYEAYEDDPEIQSYIKRIQEVN